jgi:DNA-binding NarL/FixJ family response regulator
MMEARPQILIADDHIIFADGLRLLLEKYYNVVGSVVDGRALITEALRLKPDVIVVDIGMPLLNGLDAAKRIREQLPRVKLVFLTMQDNPNLAAAALELGSAAFVLKQTAGSELLNAIDQVRHGKCYVTPKLRPDDWTVQRTRASYISKQLTSRQRDIVQMCAEGRPIKEIAGHLNLSEKTVEFHKHHIMVTCNLRSNADLVLFALKQGLISPDPNSLPEKRPS